MNSKHKGSGFERRICKALSFWVTKGKRQDVFWRSAMSGGRASVHGKDVRQAGDITAVAPEGHFLTDDWFIECKHVRDANLGGFLLKGNGPVRNFWKKTLKEAKRHKKDPMLIIRSNNQPIIIITKTNHLRHFVYPMLEVYVRGRQVDVTSFIDWMSSERPI